MLTSLLNGFGQVLLQQNVYSGILILTGIFCGAPDMGIAASIAALVSYGTARLLRFKPGNISAGLYGFNAILAGIALVNYYGLTAAVIGGIFGVSILATLLEHAFLKLKFPAFTFPFILLTWISLTFLSSHVLPETQPQGIWPGPLRREALPFIGHVYGIVIFQKGFVPGIFFFLAILVGSWRSALFATAGAIISGLLAILLNASPTEIVLGVLSFNAILCSLAFSGPHRYNIVLALGSVVLSTLLTQLMLRWNFPMLTFPFVLSAWIGIALKDAFPARFVHV